MSGLAAASVAGLDEATMVQSEGEGDWQTPVDGICNPGKVTAISDAQQQAFIDGGTLDAKVPVENYVDFDLIKAYTDAYQSAKQAEVGGTMAPSQAPWLRAGLLASSGREKARPLLRFVGRGGGTNRPAEMSRAGYLQFWAVCKIAAQAVPQNRR